MIMYFTNIDKVKESCSCIAVYLSFPLGTGQQSVKQKMLVKIQQCIIVLWRGSQEKNN